jgi:hypothetical protein
MSDKGSKSNYVRVKPLSEEEKKKLYMELDKEELVKMLIQCQSLLEINKPQRLNEDNDRVYTHACKCENPDWESGFNYCHNCHRLISEQRFKELAEQPDRCPECMDKKPVKELEAHGGICKWCYTSMNDQNRKNK